MRGNLAWRIQKGIDLTIGLRAAKPGMFALVIQTKALAHDCLHTSRKPSFQSSWCHLT